MLIEKEYRRNEQGEITKRTIVEIECDKCGTRWETAWSNRKRKTSEQDLCCRCRNKRPYIKGGTTTIICDNCGCSKKRANALLREGPKFCSLSCRDEYNVQKNYGHLFSCFADHPDEVAYLFGLVLGDGHLKKHAKRTTRVSVAFDVSGKWNHLIDVFKDVCSALRIVAFEEPKSHKNCKMIGFVLPDDLLQKYGVLYSGSKFIIQPRPSAGVIVNINYAVGLLNSDGSFSKNIYAFYNTVKSIVDSFSECLSSNDIPHTSFEYDGRCEVRTQRT